MKVCCNNCKNDFEIEIEVAAKVLKKNERVERIFFRCPFCDITYTVCITTEHTRMLIDKLRKNQGLDITMSRQYMLDKLRKTIKVEMEENKKRYERYF